MSLNTISQSPKKILAEMPPAPKRPQLFLENDTEGAKNIITVNPDAPVPPSMIKVKQTKLSDPSYPLGVDISKMVLTDYERKVFVDMGGQMGRVFDAFRASRNNQIAEIQDSLGKLSSSETLDEAKPSFNFLRSVEMTINKFQEIIKSVQQFNSRYPGFDKINSEIDELVEDYKNATNYEELQITVHNLSKVYLNFCTQYDDLRQSFKEKQDQISLVDKESLFNINSEMKNLGLSDLIPKPIENSEDLANSFNPTPEIEASTSNEMIVNLGKMRAMAYKYEDLGGGESKIELGEKIQNYTLERDKIITSLDFAINDPAQTPSQKSGYEKIMGEVLRFEVDSKNTEVSRLERLLADPNAEGYMQIKEQLNDLEKLGYSQYIAKYDYEGTMKELEYYNKAIESVILSSEPVNRQILNGEETIDSTESVGDEKIFRYAGQTTDLTTNPINSNTLDSETLQKDITAETSTALATELSLDQTDNKAPEVKETQKPTGIFQGARNLLSRFTGNKGLVGALTAATIAVATPSAVDQGLRNMAENKDVLNPKDKTELVQSLDKEGLGKGQLAETLREAPDNISTEKLAELRLKNTKPTIPTPEISTRTAKFMQDFKRSPSITPAGKILDVVIEENRDKPEIAKKLENVKTDLNTNK
jgi:hypothetical protein